MSKSFSLYLDLMRFLAAVFVVLSHFVQMNIIQGGYAYFTPELGRDAVILFFVLSGYVIAYTTDYKKPTLVEYFIARLTRIYSVVLPLLILSGIAFISLVFFDKYNDANYVYEKWYFYYPFYSFFLGEMWTISETPPLLTPYWSLSYEVWYYILFSILYFFKGYLRSVLALLIFILIGYKLWLLLPVWMLGVVLYRYDDEALFDVFKSRLLFFLSFFIFIAFKFHDIDLFLIEYGKQLWPFDNLPLGSAFAYLSDYVNCLIVLMNFYFAKHSQLNFLLFFERYIRSFADYTFTLYLTHWLVLGVFCVFVSDLNGSFSVFLCVTILVFLFTLVIGQLSEKRRFLFRDFFTYIYRKIAL